MTNLNVPGLGTFDDIAAYIDGVGEVARRASRELAKASTGAKNAALSATAAIIRRYESQLLSANRDDVAAARAAGDDDAFIDRLTLTPKSIAAMADGLLEIAALPDPVGEISDLKYRPSGIQVPSFILGFRGSRSLRCNGVRRMLFKCRCVISAQPAASSRA